MLTETRLLYNAATMIFINEIYEQSWTRRGINLHAVTLRENYGNSSLSKLRL